MADGTSDYAFSTIEGVGADTPFVRGINDDGVVYGVSDDSPFTYRDGVLTKIPVAGAYAEGVDAIGNVYGTVVFNAGTADRHVEGFVYDGNSTTYLDLGINYTQITGVSASGIAYGFADARNGGFAFEYSTASGEVIDIADTAILGADTHGDYYGTAIGGDGFTEFFFVSQGVLQELPATRTSDGGVVISSISGVNAKGQAVGKGSTAELSGAFLDDNGVISEIAFPGATGTVATAINDEGVVAGYYIGSDYVTTHGFIYRDSQYVTVDVPGAASTTIEAINDAGVIAGGYVADGTTHAFVATLDAGAPPPPTVAFDATTSGFVNGVTPILTGTASDGTASVEIFDGDPFDGGRDLGAATLNGDGTWTFRQPVGAGTFFSLTALATDASGQTGTAAAPFAIGTGLTGLPYRAAEQYGTGDGSYGYREYGRYGALLVDAVDNRDGTHTIQAFAPGQRIDSVSNDTITGFGARDRFVFAMGFGQDEVTNFVVAGTAHDTLDLSGTAMTSLAQVMHHTTMSGGSAVIHLALGDTIRLDGVTKSQLQAHPKDFAFA